MTSIHLNDDQFTRYLMDSDADGAEAAHLLGCTVCREELERFRSSVESFNSMTLAWSERHSITSPSYAAEAEIARDNQLMRAVNLEINRKEPFPLMADNVPAQRYRQGVKKRLEVRSE